MGAVPSHCPSRIKAAGVTVAATAHIVQLPGYGVELRPGWNMESWWAWLGRIHGQTGIWEAAVWQPWWAEIWSWALGRLVQCPRVGCSVTVRLSGTCSALTITWQNRSASITSHLSKNAVQVYLLFTVVFDWVFISFRKCSNWAFMFWWLES